MDSCHRTKLFGGRSLTDTLQLADTLTAIIGHPVRQGDGLPGYVCRQCLRMLEKVRALEVELESLKKSVRESSAALFIAASSSSLLASITVRVLSITGGENVITQCHLGALMNCSTLIVPPIPPLNRGKFADWTTEHNFRSQLHKIPSCPDHSLFFAWKVWNFEATTLHVLGVIY